MNNIAAYWTIIFLQVFLLSVFIPQPGYAHCDSMDGPVIKEARIALAKKNIAPLLKWIPRENETELKNAFNLVLRVRGRGNDSRQLADRFFYETLVRLHRAGEGAPFTGIKLYGSIDKAIQAGDRSLQTGSVDLLAEKISAAVKAEIKARFHKAYVNKKHSGKSVNAGRRFVSSYVDFIHFIETLHNLLKKGSGHPH